MYDYRGISDYVPINSPSAFLSKYVSINKTIYTTRDRILETPHENFTVGIYSPGIWPSPLGHLFLKVTILDRGNGPEDIDPSFLTTTTTTSTTTTSTVGELKDGKVIGTTGGPEYSKVYQQTDST